MAHREDATLLALLATRAKGQSIPSVIADVLAAGCASDAWLDRHPTDLFGQSDSTDVEDAERTLVEWGAARGRFASILSEDYPARLRSVHDAPPYLFFRGDSALVQVGGMSVVGSRTASRQGLARAEEVARLLVRREIPVISGLARGVDEAAHRATIDAGGRPIGVIATGVDAPYTPAATRDLHEQVAERGVLVSQFAPLAHAMKHTFLQRNATMSGLGLATIIIEAGEHSGARAQARMAMEHGRPVVLTDEVVSRTEWGALLANGDRPNVLVAASLGEVEDAVDRILALSSLAMQDLDKVLARA